MGHYEKKHKPSKPKPNLFNPKHSNQDKFLPPQKNQ